LRFSERHTSPDLSHFVFRELRPAVLGRPSGHHFALDLQQIYFRYGRLATRERNGRRCTEGLSHRWRTQALGDRPERLFPHQPMHEPVFPVPTYSAVTVPLERPVPLETVSGPPAIFDRALLTDPLSRATRNFGLSQLRLRGRDSASYRLLVTLVLNLPQRFEFLLLRLLEVFIDGFASRTVADWDASD